MNLLAIVETAWEGIVEATHRVTRSYRTVLKRLASSWRDCLGESPTAGGDGSPASNRREVQRISPGNRKTACRDSGCGRDHRERLLVGYCLDRSRDRPLRGTRSLSVWPYVMAHF